MRAPRTTGAVLAAVLGTTGAATLAPAAAAAPGVCDGVRGCKVVARVDVDGDGTKDAVGVARRSGKGAPEGRVVVRVRTDRGILKATRTTSYWFGAPFHGTSDLDGRGGREVVVGATTGAHTSFYWVLTVRKGALETLPAPAFGKQWAVDSAAMVTLGWHRTAEQPAGRVQLRQGERIGSTKRFDVRLTTYRWKGGWKVVDRDRKSVSETKAWKWGGWHVPGLPRW